MKIILYLFLLLSTVSANCANALVNIKDFGAKGDGKTDDAAAIRKAADFAAENNKTLFIPKGKFLFNSTIKMNCSIKSEGNLIRILRFDHSKTKHDTSSFIKIYTPQKSPQIIFVNDSPAKSLNPKFFTDIKAGDSSLPQWRDIPLLNSSKKITLKKGGVLTFLSSDFFTARRNAKNDTGYPQHDICQLVSDNGNISPQFMFNWGNKVTAKPWNSRTFYKRGTYCTFRNQLYKAAFNSGPGAFYKHKYLGKVDIGAQSPEIGKKYCFKYKNGRSDSIKLWIKCYTVIKYSSPQKNLIVEGLTVKTYVDDKAQIMFPVIKANAVFILRSNMVFKDMKIINEDKRLMPAMLCSASRVCNIKFINCSFSGATMPLMGYNLLIFNCANISLKNCTSLRARCGYAARHGKNITIDGGTFGTIDDHYGFNYRIKNVTIKPTAIFVPNFRKPTADINNWSFKPGRAFAFSGRDFSVEHCKIIDCHRVFEGRPDSADVYGKISLKNINIKAKNNVQIYSHWLDNKFDYAHKVLLADEILIDNISINSPHTLNFNIVTGSKYLYPKLTVKNCSSLQRSNLAVKKVDFINCKFVDPVFTSPDKKTVMNFTGCTGQK